MSDSKKIKWSTLSFMAFSTVWGFGNVVNGFGYFNGVEAIFSWVMIFALYFIPYALMVGELGSAFKNHGGGVSSWVHETMGPKIAYYAGWTYWVVHIPYIASKPLGALKAGSWALFQNGTKFDSFDTLYVQLATLVIFLLFAWIATYGLNPLKKLTSIAGSSMFVMSILFIIMMMAAPAINPDGGFNSIDWSFDSLIPTFDWKYFTSLSILVFAVGGCEKISPYVNKVEDPAHGFPKGIIAMAIMVSVCAILGTVAMGMMFSPADINADFDSFIANGAYLAFQQLGEYYGVGNAFMVVYAICNCIGQLSTLVLSIDAPLRMLLDNSGREFIPEKLLKKNDKGAYVNGILMVVVIVSILIIVPALGIGEVSALLRSFTQLNSVCMPLRYLWVFVAYIALRKAKDKYNPEYRFVKAQGPALFFGFWCFALTAFCCILGMFKGSMFEIALNIATPILLLGLGLILPLIAKREKHN